MLINVDGKYINSEHVTAIVPEGRRVLGGGAVTSRGTRIYLSSGLSIRTGMPTTQVAAMFYREM